MTIDDLLELLEETLEDGKGVVLTNKIMVDGGRMKEIIEDIRLNMPEEIRQAKKIVEDRATILNRAAHDAELIIKKAEEQQKFLVSENEVTKLAQTQANAMLAKATAESNEVVSTANQRANEMRNAAAKFVDDLMRRSDETLFETLSEIRRARQNFKNVQSEEE